MHSLRVLAHKTLIKGGRIITLLGSNLADSTEWSKLQSPARSHIDITPDAIHQESHIACSILAENVWFQCNYEKLSSRNDWSVLFKNITSWKTNTEQLSWWGMGWKRTKSACGKCPEVGH